MSQRSECRTNRPAGRPLSSLLSDWGDHRLNADQKAASALSGNASKVAPLSALVASSGSFASSGGGASSGSKRKMSALEEIMETDKK